MSLKQHCLEILRVKVIECTSCCLHKGRTQIVFGEGNLEAKVMFIGEAPGASEDATGRPFVGRAGKLLDNMIASMGLKRDDVYIANICKCRPPANRKPKPDEMDTCKQFLLTQLNTIKPKVIIALGNTALEGLTGSGGISKRCGEWEELLGMKLMPCFHPSALLRNPSWKEPAWHALQKAALELL
jgi:uracil-DNA glycosylase